MTRWRLGRGCCQKRGASIRCLIMPCESLAQQSIKEATMPDLTYRVIELDRSSAGGRHWYLQRGWWSELRSGHVAETAGIIRSKFRVDYEWRMPSQAAAIEKMQELNGSHQGLPPLSCDEQAGLLMIYDAI